MDLTAAVADTVAAVVTTELALTGPDQKGKWSLRRCFCRLLFDIVVLR